MLRSNPSAVLDGIPDVAGLSGPVHLIRVPRMRKT